MNWAKLVRETDEPGVYFVYDELNRNEAREKLCALRKYPALLRLGFHRLTCPKSWQKIDQWSSDQFEFEAPEFVHMDDIAESPDRDLAAISDQYYEDKLPVFSLSQVVDRYTVSDARMVVGGDDRSFETAGAHRPLSEMEFVEEAYNYRDVYSAFENRYKGLGYHFPLDYCLNVYVQENALLYELVTDNSIRSTSDFFDILPEAPYLPVWTDFTQIFTAGVDHGTRLLDDTERTGLAKWLRRRIELNYHEGKETAAYLNDLARRRERLFDPVLRAELPEAAAAREYLAALERNDCPNFVQNRFRHWLTETTRVDEGAAH
jgi:hypothetical protein